MGEVSQSGAEPAGERATSGWLAGPAPDQGLGANWGLRQLEVEAVGGWAW